MFITQSEDVFSEKILLYPDKQKHSKLNSELIIRRDN